jgi:hypothetical protein
MHQRVWDLRHHFVGPIGAYVTSICHERGRALNRKGLIAAKCPAAAESFRCLRRHGDRSPAFGRGRQTSPKFGPESGVCSGAPTALLRCRFSHPGRARAARMRDPGSGGASDTGQPKPHQRASYARGFGARPRAHDETATPFPCDRPRDGPPISAGDHGCGASEADRRSVCLDAGVPPVPAALGDILRLSRDPALPHLRLPQNTSGTQP